MQTMMPMQRAVMLQTWMIPDHGEYRRLPKENGYIRQEKSSGEQEAKLSAKAPITAATADTEAMMNGMKISNETYGTEGYRSRIWVRIQSCRHLKNLKHKT
jgi:hypothetical protein